MQGFLKLVAEDRQALTQAVVASSGTQHIRLDIAAEQVLRPVSREHAKVYTPVGLFNRGRGIFRKAPTRGDDLGDSTFFWIEEGDLILSGQFAWEGAIALATTEEAGCVASHRYHILRGKGDHLQTVYLYAFLRTSFGHLLLNEHSRGAAGRNRPLNIRTLLKEKVPVPRLSEQTRLVELVTFEKQLAASIAHFSDHLREFHIRLAADVVTGKVDVRKTAAQLPEELEVAAEDVEMLGDVEDLAGESLDDYVPEEAA
jgi:type I restriction enzyme S subunit